MSSISELRSSGARKLSGDDFASELVGRTLDSGGWTWVISADGTSVSTDADGTQHPSVWYLAGDAYCRTGPGGSRYGCLEIYELAGVYRFAGDKGFADLAGWSVTAGPRVGPALPPRQAASARAAMDTGELLSSGETLTARHVAGLELTDGDGEGRDVASSAWRSFNVRRGDDGELAARVEHEAYVFAASDRDPSSPGTGYCGSCADGEGDYAWLYSWSGDIADLGSSTGDFYEVFHAGYSFDSLARERRGFAIVGNPTLSLPAAGTAAYSGNLYVDAYDTEGVGHYSSATRTQWTSSLTLTADFSSSTLSGRLDNWQTRPGNEDEFSPWEGLVAAMPATPFGADGFKGRLTFENPGTNNITASYEGSFYGPDADSVAGTLTGSGIIGGKPFVAIGWFGADKDN